MQDEERVRDGRVHVVVLPTTERTAKRIDGAKDIVVVDGDRGGIEIRSFSFPLDFYLRKEIISRRQWRAGNRLHRLWSSACGDGYVQFQYREKKGGAPKMEFTPPGAYSPEYSAAMLAIRSLAARKVAYEVCCEGRTLAKLAGYSSPRTAQRRGMEQLLEALDNLVAHFRLAHE